MERAESSRQTGRIFENCRVLDRQTSLKAKTDKTDKTAMPNPLERSLQASTIRKLNALRAQDSSLVFRKRHGSSMGLAGDPDLYGLWAGIHWELELKALRAKPTRLQLARSQEWARAGAIVGIADSPAAVDEFLACLASYARVRHEAMNPTPPQPRAAPA